MRAAFGGRGSASYSDRFDTGIGDVGVLAGFFHSKDRVPEGLLHYQLLLAALQHLAKRLLRPPAPIAPSRPRRPPTTTLAPTPYYISNTYNYREPPRDQ